MAELDIASILFPDDAPKPTQMPEWAQVQRNNAEARLMGQHGDQAARLFPNEAKPDAADVANEKTDDPAAVLFKEDAAKAAEFDSRAVTGFTDGFALSAAADGDMDRAHALQAAGDALAADFRTAGTDAAEVKDALDIVRERAGTIGGPSVESIQAEYETSMAAIQAEGISEVDLSAARRFVADLEVVAPGTIASLEHTGAGNDLKLIRSAIREAKRRGYR